MYKKILLAVDGSDNAMRATNHAIELAKINDATVDVITVIDYDQRRNEVIHWKDEEEVALERKERYDPTIRKLKMNGILYETHVLYGNPGTTIVAQANKGNYDLVLMGSRGLNVFQEMLIGSVSKKVVKHAKCPVMVVK